MLTRKSTILALLAADGVSLIDGLTNSVELCMTQTRPDLNSLSEFVKLHGLQHSFNNIVRGARAELEAYEQWENSSESKRDPTPPKQPDLNHVAVHFAKVCDRLELSLDDIAAWNVVPAPWSMARFRDEIFVVICEREVKKLSATHARSRRIACAHHDIIAYTRITDFVRKLANRPNVRLVPIPFDLTPQEARAKLDELEKQNPAGIVCVGSTNGNPLSDVASRAAFDLDYDAPRDTEAPDGPILPAHFVWGHDVPNDFMAYPNPASRSPGIRFVGSKAVELHRETNGRGVPDAGIMLLDARTRPFKSILAGHGGLGTLAATESFLDVDSIAEKLQDSDDLRIFRGISTACKDRVFNVLEVSDQPTGGAEGWFEAPPSWESGNDVFWRYGFD